MKFRQLMLSLIALILVAALVGCSSSSTPPPPPPPAISVALVSPPASMAVSSTMGFTATVSNDSSSAGVAWSVTCGSADCGSFSAGSTGSGVATNYTAPATVPTGSSVTVKATSVADNTKSASAVITITGASTLADGTYVFSIQGQDTDSDGSFYGNPYAVVGAITVASGAITGGEQDFIDYNLATLTDSITGGAVSATADGNVQITITTGDASVGVAGVETLNGAQVSASKVLISEFDTFATSSGTLELQTSATPSGGGYAFTTNGFDASACPAVFGGVLNVDGSGTVSGAGSVFDLNDCGNQLIAQVVDPSTVTAPDAFGRVQVSLVLSTSGVGGLGLVGYSVDGSKVVLVENNNDPNDVFFGTQLGTAYNQGANTGTFSATSVEGSSFVFGTLGADPTFFIHVAGAFTTNVDGTTVNGTLNWNDLTGAGVQAPIPFTGTYTVDSTGRVSLINLTDGATFTFNLEAYLDGTGRATIASIDFGEIVAGSANVQTGGGSFTAASFSGTYGMGTTGIAVGTGSEFDTVGTAQADGVSVLTGTVDQNLLFGVQTAGLAFTDGYTADPSGVFTATITGLDATTPANTDAFTYYLIDTTRVVAIETDPNQLTLGYLELMQ